MYNRTNWTDHVLDDPNLYLLEDQGNNTCHITHASPVRQVGTEQDAAHFNNIEGGIVDAHVAINLLLIALRQMSWRVDELAEQLNE